MAVNLYPGGDQPVTPNFGLALYGMELEMAYNFLIIDANLGGGGGGSVHVNGSSVTNPNFNGTTPAAPGGNTNVTFQVSGSNISAYVPSAGGSGTVTSFSAGNIGSIITTSVATPTSTPALTFSLATELANTVWAGPTSGGAVTPTFRALVSADIPALSYISTGLMTTAGDIIYENSTPVAARLAIGTTGQVLTVVSGLPAWSTPSSGSVSSFSSGSLSPLFTTSVATPTSTPALSFSLSNAAQNSVFAGPASGGTGAPSYRALVPLDTANLSTVSFSATPTFNAASFSNFKITLTGNVTSSTLSNAVAGQTLIFEIVQDGTGGHTFVWPTNVKNAMSITGQAGAANETSIQEFFYDGSNAYAISPGMVYP
jgi:hypothetical protein